MFPMLPRARPRSAVIVVLMLSALSLIAGASALTDIADNDDRTPGRDEMGAMSAMTSWTPIAAIGTLVEPGMPTGLTATAGDGQVELSWTAPASDGGAEIEHYVVFQDDREVVNVTGTSATITGLTNGIEYDFSVAAHNKVGTGIVSEVVSATPTASTTVPGPPTGLTATAGSDRIQLYWSAPSSEGSSAITGYVLYWSLDPNGGFSPISVDGTSYMHEGLESGRTYHYKVAAVNQAGEGNASGIVSVIMPSPSVLPSEVVGLAATVNGSAIEITWSAPASDGGSVITGYMIYRGTGEDDLKHIATVTGTSFVDDNAESMVKYHYQVCAVNANGIGVSAVTVSAMIEASSEQSGLSSIEYLIAIVVVVAAILAAIVLLMRRGRVS